MKRQREQSPATEEAEQRPPYEREPPKPAREQFHSNQTDPSDVAANRRDKRRRDIVERVERLRKDSNDRRESIFHEILTSMHAAHMSLLSTPHPTHGPYLLRLNELSNQRETAISQTRVHSVYRQNLARKLHDLEVERIEDEYELAKKGVKEKLLEACDERAKKLKEEKDAVELNLESMFETQTRPHLTRQRPARANRYVDLANGTDSSHSNHSSNMTLTKSNGIGNAHVPLPASNSASVFMEGSTSYALGNSQDNNFPYSLLPASPLLSNFPVASKDGAATANAMLNPSALLSTIAPLPVARATRKKNLINGLPAYIANPAAQGLPTQSQQFNIQPGKYEFGGRSLLALKALTTEDINEDLDRLRRRNSSRRHARAARI